MSQEYDGDDAVRTVIYADNCEPKSVMFGNPQNRQYCFIFFFLGKFSLFVPVGHIYQLQI